MLSVGRPYRYYLMFCCFGFHLTVLLLDVNTVLFGPRAKTHFCYLFVCKYFPV